MNVDRDRRHTGDLKIKLQFLLSRCWVFLQKAQQNSAQTIVYVQPHLRYVQKIMLFDHLSQSSNVVNNAMAERWSARVHANRVPIYQPSTFISRKTLSQRILVRLDEFQAEVVRSLV